MNCKKIYLALFSYYKSLHCVRHLLSCHLLLAPPPLPPPLYFLKHLFPFSSHFSPRLHLLFISSTLSCKLFSIIPAYFPFLLPPPLSYLAFSSFSSPTTLLLLLFHLSQSPLSSPSLQVISLLPPPPPFLFLSSFLL